MAHKVLAEAWPERAAAYHRRLLEAYFSENRDISDGDVLVDLAEEIGVDASEFRDVAQRRTQAMTELVISEHNSALEQGVTAVPTAVFAGAFPVPGAQPVETYERIVDAILERQPSGES